MGLASKLKISRMHRVLGRPHIAAGIAFAILLTALAQPLRAQRAHMQITVERRVGDKPLVSNPQHVFKAGDYIRFRFRPSFDGYLYVMDKATSGKYLLLFPAQDSGNVNQVTAGKEYVVPAASGSWFRIDDPPGYETVYFLMTPTPITKEAASVPPAEPPVLAPPPVSPSPSPITPPPDLTPRCDDSLFRARGDCIDTSAGPRSVPTEETVPDALASDPSTTSRDITVINKPTSSVVAPNGPANAPVIYEFRLAHR